MPTSNRALCPHCRRQIFPHYFKLYFVCSALYKTPSTLSIPQNLSRRFSWNLMDVLKAYSETSPVRKQEEK